MVVLDLIEIAVHIIYGWGCWGLQAGGPINSLLVPVMTVVFLATAVSVMISANSILRFLIRAFTLLLASAFIITAYVHTGWRIFTSIHNQGPENLLLIAAINVGVLVLIASLWIELPLRKKTAGLGPAAK